MDGLRVRVVEQLVLLRALRTQVRECRKTERARCKNLEAEARHELVSERLRLTAQRDAVAADIDGMVAREATTAEGLLTLLGAGAGRVLSVWVKRSVLPVVTGSSPACLDETGAVVRLKGAELRSICRRRLKSYRFLRYLNDDSVAVVDDERGPYPSMPAAIKAHVFHPVTISRLPPGDHITSSTR